MPADTGKKIISARSVARGGLCGVIPVVAVVSVVVPIAGRNTIAANVTTENAPVTSATEPEISFSAYTPINASKKWRRPNYGG